MLDKRKRNKSFVIKFNTIYSWLPISKYVIAKNIRGKNKMYDLTHIYISKEHKRYQRNIREMLGDHRCGLAFKIAMFYKKSNLQIF